LVLPQNPRATASLAAPMREFVEKSRPWGRVTSSRNRMHLNEGANGTRLGSGVLRWSLRFAGQGRAETLMAEK
jgi:hypothetical protein